MPLLALEILEDRSLPSIVFQPQFQLAGAENLVQPLGHPNPVGLLPSQVRHAYGLDQILLGNGSHQGDGTGQTIAIVDAFDDPTIASDLALFDSTLGIPAPPSFTKVAQDGSNNYPGTDPTKGWEIEESLDVEWAHALAPAASILLVEANSATMSDLNTGVTTAANYSGVVAISMSWGGSEFSGETNLDSTYTTPSGHAGVTFLAATGDNGAPGLYPAFSPNVVAAGGTFLTTDSSGDYISETGWSGSGGGISQYESQPSYQNGFYNSTQRTIPDLAFNAANGVAIADSFTYGSSTPWEAVQGTSVSSPCLASLVAIADQGLSVLGQGSLDGRGGTLPALYQAPASDYHDITTGNNGFAAGPGYDLVTGRGTPIAPFLVHHLIHTPATRTWTGGGSDSNWSDAANWGGTAPSPGDDLVFASGASALTAVNDFPSGTEFDAITISGAGYAISGNDIALLGGLNASAATGSTSFSINTTLLSGLAWTTGGSGSSLTLTGNINNEGFTLAIGGSGSIAFDGIISGAGGLTYTGTGTLTLGGSAANTYTGPTAIQSGTLVLNNSAGTAVPGALTIGTTSTTATVRLNAAAQTSSSTAVTINSSSLLDLNGNADAIGTLSLTGASITTEAGALTLNGDVTASGTSSISGNLTLAGTSTFTVNGTGTLTVSAAIGGSGGLTKAGSGTLAITVGGSYSGGTTLNAGTLAVGDPAALGTGTVTLAAGTISATGAAVSLANAVSVTGNFSVGGTLGLTFTGPVTLTGNRTVTVASSVTATFGGAIGESGGSRVLTKAGSGTLVLAGSNTYSGGTVVSAGTLSVGNAAALGSGNLTVNTGTTLSASASGLTLPNTVTVAGNFTLGGSNALTFSAAVSLTGNRTITVNSGIADTFAGGVSGQSLTKSGPGTLVLPVSDSYTSGTNLTSGTLTIGDPGALGSGALTLTSGTLSATGSAINLTNAVVLAGNASLGGSVNITFSSGNGVTLTGNRTLSVTGSGVMTIATFIHESVSGRSFTKSGSGTLVLQQANSYTGGSGLTAGTLLLGDNNALGTGLVSLTGGTLAATGEALTLANNLSLAGTVGLGGSLDLNFAGTATLTGNCALNVTNTGTTTFANTIMESGGSRALTKNGSGLLVLSGANTYSGGTVLTAGTLGVGVVNALGTGTLTLRGGTIVAQGGAMTLANAVVLGGNVTFGGSNDLIFTGAVTLTGNRTLTVTNTGMTTFTGAIGQSGGHYGLTKSGSQTLTLTGTSTYTGATTISRGTLLVNGTLTSAVTVSSGGALAGSGNVGAVTVSSGGTLAPGTSSDTAILSTANVALGSGAAFNVVLGGLTPGSGGYDQLNVTGTVNLGSSTLNVSVTFPVAVGNSFTIINNDGTDAIVGTFHGLAEGATFVVSGMTFQITYRGGDGNDVVVTRIA
jgi:autotransporter-associated beta strand protein